MQEVIHFPSRPIEHSQILKFTIQRNWEIAEKAKDTAKLKAWEEKGGKAFFHENKISGEAVIIKFTKKPDNEIRKVLRQHGMKWNSLRKEWEGVTNYLNLKSVVENIGGVISKLNVEVIDSAADASANADKIT